MVRAGTVDRQRRSLLLGLLLSLALVASPLMAPRAEAAPIPVTNLTVTVDKHQVTTGWDEPIVTSISFCTPDSASAGDTITVALPTMLGK